MAIHATYAKPQGDGSHAVPLWAVAQEAHRHTKAVPAYVVRSCPTCSSHRIIANGPREGQLACLIGIRGASLVGSFDCSLYTPESEAYRLPQAK